MKTQLDIENRTFNTIETGPKPSIFTKSTDSLLLEMPKASCLSLLPTYGPALIQWTQ